MRGRKIQMKLDKEDFLLKQIDEFREKAFQLQELLFSKENKVEELQTIVNERENKAEEMAQILTIRQEEAEKIMKDVNMKLDELSKSVSEQMAEVETALTKQINGVDLVMKAQLAESNAAIAKQTSKTDAILKEQITAIEANLGGQMSEIKIFTEEQIAAIKSTCLEEIEASSKLSKEQIAEVRKLLEDTSGKLEAVKTEISEKVHQENVKCYRNVHDMLYEFDLKSEKLNKIKEKTESIGGYVKCLTWFSIINFVVLIAYILFSLGVF